MGAVAGLIVSATMAATPWMSVTAQVVESEIGPLTRYPATPQTGRSARDNAVTEPNVALYATAFLGAPGTVDGVSLSAQGGFHYPTVHLLFSAAALPLPRTSDYRLIGNLRRLNAHVTLTALDSARTPIEARGALYVLATLPDTSIPVTARADSGSGGIGTAALRAVSRALLPEATATAALGKRLSSVAIAFTGLYHRPSAKLQVAYVSDEQSFGWMYHAHDNDVIEGSHRATAALEIGPAVRYIRVQIRLVGEWQSQGSWQRDVDLTFSVTGAPGS